MMKKTTKTKAASKGARTELDFSLFATLVGRLAKVSAFLSQLGEPGELPEFQGMLLRHKYILERGMFCESQPMPKGFRCGKPKECYGNSFDLTTNTDGLAYCEGFAFVQLGKDKITDIEHGWCINSDGKVIDVTLKEPGLAYFGVKFNRKELTGKKRLPIIDSIVLSQLKAHLTPIPESHNSVGQV